MNYLSVKSSVLVLFLALVAISCADNGSSAATATPAATNPIQNSATPVAVGGVDHYTCPNGHPGAAAAGNCAACGVALEHNQAYHDTQAAVPTTTPTTATTPAQNALGVYHYTCPSGHPGAGAAGSCASCGLALVHNQAYHDGPAGATTIAPAAGATPGNGATFSPMLQENQGKPAGAIQTQPVTTASPAQNAAGVYHYTCPNGHPGAGAAGSCASCGSALVHNQAYHN